MRRLGGVRGGVDAVLAVIGLKVIPVVILGGLDSILGAIVGGLLVGVLENLAGGYLDPLFGGGVKEVAPFVILVLILMIKPYGLFGKVHIDRVYHRCKSIPARRLAMHAMGSNIDAAFRCR